MNNDKQFQWTVDEIGEGSRLDRFVSEQVGDEFSRSYIQKCIREGRCTHEREGQQLKVRMSEMVHEGDVVSIEIPSHPSSELTAEDIDLPVIFEDEHLIIINKPAGMVVHPGAGNYTGTIANALLGRDFEAFSAMDDDEHRPGIVHRLDKETSGVLVVAKHPRAKEKMMRHFAFRRVDKFYLALVRGIVNIGRGTLDYPIARSRSNRRKMETSNHERAKEAVSHYRVLAQNKGATLCKIKIDTGRTHQIRVHMSEMGFPVIGDKLYGQRRLEEQDSPERHILHAWRLRFLHPMTQQEMVITAPVPKDFSEVCEKFGIRLNEQYLQ